jgi:mannan endo-1,4-beta-mannosidase
MSSYSRILVFFIFFCALCAASAAEQPGLRGDYFSGSDFQDLRLTRTDAQIAFNWGVGAPDAALPADHFCVRWSGTLTPTFSEMYTLTATGDDGIRVRIGSTLVIDRWTNQSARPVSGQISLVAHQAVPITIEYYENSGFASVKLEWASAHQVRGVIPTTAFRCTPLEPLPPGTGSGLLGQ